MRGGSGKGGGCTPGWGGGGGGVLGVHTLYFQPVLMFYVSLIKF